MATLCLFDSELLRQVFLNSQYYLAYSTTERIAKPRWSPFIISYILLSPHTWYFR